MKRSHIKIENVKKYLLERKWTALHPNEKFCEFQPPEDLLAPEAFSLTLPINDVSVDAQSVLYSVTQSLADLYDISLPSLERIFSQEGTILSIRMCSETADFGEISFVSFEGVMEKLKNLLLDAATFAIQNNPVIDEIPDEAHRYLERCLFQQTELGSFVAKVKLPSDGFLSEPTLFDEVGVKPEAVEHKLLQTFELVTNGVFQNRPDIYEDKFLKDVNLNLIEDVDEMFKKADSKTIGISFLKLQDEKSLSSGELTEQKKVYLGEYIKFLKKKFLEQIDIDVKGRIVELRSRNPESNQNYIVIRPENRDLMPVATHLDTERYQKAIQAHKSGRSVRIKGRGRQMKTQLKFEKIETLEIL